MLFSDFGRINTSELEQAGIFFNPIENFYDLPFPFVCGLKFDAIKSTGL